MTVRSAGSERDPERGRDGVHVLVAAAAEADEDVLVRGQASRATLHRVVDGVRRLERRDDALAASQRLEAFERLLVVDRDVFGALARLQPASARARRRGSRGRPRCCASPGSGRPRPAAGRCACRGARPAVRRPASPSACPLPTPSPPASTPMSRTGSSRNGWNSPMALLPPPTQAIATSGSLPACSQHLRARLLADDRLEVAHDRGERVRPDGRADDVVRRLDVRHPVAHRLVDGVLERLAADSTETSVAPSIFMRKTLSDWRLMSSLPM